MSIYRRGKRWTGDFVFRGERFWLGTHATKKAAQAAEGRKRRDLQGLSPETFEGWAKRWLRDYARPATTTRKTYRYAVDRLVDEFGTRPLSSIDRMEARAATQGLPRQPLKIIRAMLNDAIDAGLIDANPFAGLRLEQSRGRKDLDALTEDEIAGEGHQVTATWRSTEPSHFHCWLTGVSGAAVPSVGSHRRRADSAAAPQAPFSTRRLPCTPPKTYDGLPPGTYTLHVAAFSNETGLRDPTPAVDSFRIPPPPHGQVKGK